MNTRLNKAIKAITLLLILAVAQTYVHANLFKSSLGLLTEATPDGGAPTSGRLTTRGNNPVSVNGNAARTGETVFSGQQIRTPAGTGATIDFGALGRFDIAPNTSLTLTFSADAVRARLESGCVIVNPGEGIKGAVETSRPGSTETTESVPGSSLDVCTTPGGTPVVNDGAAADAGAGSNGRRGRRRGGLFGLGTNGTTSLLGATGIIATAATTMVIAAPCRRGRNPSPGVPRGRNDECR